MILPDDVIVVDPQPLRDRYAQLLETKTTQNRMTIDERGRGPGAVCEAALLEVGRGCFRNASSYDYDLLHVPLLMRIEVKSKRQGRPGIHMGYEGSVQDRRQYGHSLQECDAYVFCRAVTQEEYFSHVYIYGWMWRNRFKQACRVMRQGQQAGNMKHGQIRHDCYNIYYRELLPMAQLLDWEEEHG